ncbi:MAG: hypothetical protein IBX47_04580 [Desulfuromonadales bacterium]|nr:hypothetical protein [Desulfuromonadales bacterium]
MKDQPQLFIDQRGSELRALISEGGEIYAESILPGPLEGGNTLKNLIAALTAKSGRKPLHAHLLIATEQVKLSSYHLQEMPINDVKKIIERGISSTTGEKDPIFRLTPLAPQQDKDVYLAEQIPRGTIIRLLQQFKEAGIKLASVSTGLQATLAAFEPQRKDILQAQVIFDINRETVTATFLSSTELLHFETVTIQDSGRELEEEDEADSGRELKRRLFAILNLIHGLYSQYMRMNPLFPVEKVWLCGPGSDLAGLEESLIDAMDIEVVSLDLLAGQISESRPYTPLSGLINALRQNTLVNFIPAEISNPVWISTGAKIMAVGAFIVLLLITAGLVTQFGIWDLKKQLSKRESELQFLQVQATANQNRLDSLKFLKQLDQPAPPFYTIFGEMADQLPREVQLDSLKFRQGEKSGSLEIVAVIKHETPWKNEQIFTSLMSTLDNSDYLNCNKEPNLSILQANEKRLIKITVNCQTGSAQKKSRL